MLVSEDIYVFAWEKHIFVLQKLFIELMACLGLCYDVLSMIQFDACLCKQAIPLCAYKPNGMPCVIVRAILVLPVSQTIAFLGPASLLVGRLVSRPGILHIITLRYDVTFLIFLSRGTRCHKLIDRAGVNLHQTIVSVGISGSNNQIGHDVIFFLFFFLLFLLFLLLEFDSIYYYVSSVKTFRQNDGLHKKSER